MPDANSMSLKDILKAMVEDKTKPLGGFQSFVTDETVNDVVCAAAEAAEKEENTFSIYKFESLFDGIAPLLQNCMRMVNEAKDLQASAQRRILDYWNFNETSELLERMEKDAFGARNLEALQSSSSNAAKAFGGGESPIEKGFAETATGQSMSYASEQKYQKKAEPDVAAKWAHSKNYQQALQERHGQRGGALNYDDRYKKLMLVLKATVRAAVLRARVVRAALKSFYNVDVALPPTNSEGYVENLLLWLYEADKAYRTERHAEVRTVVVRSKHYGSSKEATLALDISLNEVLTGGFVEKAELLFMSPHVPAAFSDAYSRLGSTFRIAIDPPSQQLHRFKLAPTKVKPSPIKGAVAHSVDVGTTTFDFTSEAYYFQPGGTWNVEIKPANNTAGKHESILVTLRLEIRGRSVK